MLKCPLQKKKDIVTSSAISRVSYKVTQTYVELQEHLLQNLETRCNSSNALQTTVAPHCGGDRTTFDVARR